MHGWSTMNDLEVYWKIIFIFFGCFTSCGHSSWPVRNYKLLEILAKD